jgi:hypothetical protein
MIMIVDVADMAMEFKGSASLHNGNINVLKNVLNNVHNNLDLRVERVNQNIGRVYVVDQEGNAQPIPPAISMADRVGAAVAPHNDEFHFLHERSLLPLLRCPLQMHDHILRPF